MTFAFGKYHGLGNDFAIVDVRGEAALDAQLTPEVVRALCDRRTGIGADGILSLHAARTADAVARMRVLNADGSVAEMCGNGIRCVVKYLVERTDVPAGDSIVVDTDAGPLRCTYHGSAGVVESVTVNMGAPRLARAEIPMSGPADERCIGAPLPVGDAEIAITAVSMGNPHAIAFVNDSGDGLRRLAETLGPSVETHAWFPNRTNSEFAAVHRPDDIELVVWERGCGITQACGTGACATAVAACLDGKSAFDQPITVRLLGGPLEITVASDMSHVLMRGPAVHVYDGIVDRAALKAALR